MSLRTRIRSSFREMTRFYSAADRAIAAAREQHPSPCKEGCNACCRQLPTASIVEGLCIVDTLFRRGNGAFDRAAESAARFAAMLGGDPKLNNEAWFEKQLACPLLADGLCSVYDVRPVTCRTMLVAEPDSSKCQVAYKGLVGHIDLSMIRRSGLVVSKGCADGLGVPMLYGPLPVVLYWACLLYAQGPDTFKRSIKGKPWETEQGCIAFWASRLEGDRAMQTEPSSEPVEASKEEEAP